ncbi:hypothetical protein A3K34_04335 [candidate division WWE3 bacterium RIFOXYC1_FULL_40_10]|uniref:DUF948 domain-containing protein n=1 Tax=candidate division WWE3 bacterium RIFOXYA2_FULL_46_9 TaxID=1802636 RepID=A0A1F4W163_UNCKA|nr:MAG: hypothetical protein A3K58_04335 [candidate division WWE3 bacterium RIFOXYB1_FULL_40_22]OGC62070.1 MAG: hypothetical protein A3K37_04335 [candidate division WWE3 bacterium RIFOXYA1_FULL_40_11]OGC63085.1 MAG: hypothetical protein A2264_00080 [candidate division WWE3 bacterium RIFOXYA2_FULL_46_9]OGC64985.1 MAG: hypothetical protein A2326_03030 [candidate division WWE3 bacterium RIFOXYB2_FULL_41_6]OGC66453.1 MAG: hypothetical protein A3K34_04335 [candidate division WWE3 bacterium RIFOXYC1_
MDILQIALIVVLILLAVNLVIVAIYVTLTMREFRAAIKKASNVLDNVETVSEPLSAVAGIIAGVSQSVKTIKEIGNLIDSKKRKEE